MLGRGFIRLFSRGVSTHSQLSGAKLAPGVVRRTSVIGFQSNLYQKVNNSKRSYSEVNSIAKEKNKDEIEGEDDSEYYVDVSNIEKRWKSLNFDTQQDIISYLNVKQEFGWEYLTKDEKRAIYYIAYGTWGPRDPAVMSTAEFVFKLMTNMLLFSVLGFSLMNYAIDKEKIAEMEAPSPGE